jgi:hypothetical protein
MSRTLSFVVLLLMLSVSASTQTTPTPELLNFAGRLAKPNGTPVADGTYTIRFSLWSAVSNGTEKWFQIMDSVLVRNGAFAVLLGNGNPITADVLNGDTYLEIKVGNDTPLSPRQRFASVAYALKANTVPDNTITTAKIAHGAITPDKIADNAFANPTNFSLWSLLGNTGTSPLTHFLGTTDNQSLSFRVNNQRALRIEPANYTYDTVQNYYVRSINILGGYELNAITPGSIGTTISGGGWFDNQYGSFFNRATGVACTVGGGAANTAGDPANTPISVNYITVSGGYGNYANAWGATIAGGQNSNATGLYDVISGGTGNIARDFASVIAGGQNNVASGTYAVVGGGYQSTASGYAATVSGGQFNVASNSYSFAAGRRANAQHVSAFVWADSTDTNFASTAANQFNIRASGGVRIFSKSNLSTGVTLAANDGAWSSVSDHNAKTDFRAIDTLDILERLVTIPITTWNYKGVENPILHIGPMAQDFYAAFGVGMDDKHISTIDADGVALAAIQGLNRKFKDIETNNAALKKENAELKTVLADILKRLEKVEANSHR